MVILLRNDIDKFNDHPSFLKRAKSVTPDCYYAEFVAKIFDTTTFPTVFIYFFFFFCDKNNQRFFLKKNSQLFRHGSIKMKIQREIYNGNMMKVLLIAC